ncbi:MAG: alpha/beta fold hydrolase [Rhizobiaceae bacterium]
MFSKDGTAYDLEGAENAPVVALIHGLGMTRESTWGQIVPHLTDKFRVLTYDLCGHGDTALPEATVNLTRLSEQLVSLLNVLSIDRAALVGFSLGGMINRRCAIDFPDRVSALAILNSPHDRGAEQQKLVEERARDTASGGPSAGIEKTLERWFTQRFRKSHPDRVAAVRDVVLANDPDNYAAHRQVLASGVVELIRPDPPLTHPTIVITCEHDSGSTPAMSQAIANEIEGSEIIIVPALQHLGLIEDPHAFADPIRQFLTRNTG